MARQKPNSEHTKTPPELQKCVAFVGLFTRVATNLGITPSHALQVAKGKRQSKRVQAALIREVRRIDRLAGKAA